MFRQFLISFLKDHIDMISIYPLRFPFLSRPTLKLIMSLEVIIMDYFIH